jgi:transcriptional regulator with XRE-family HTH domain
MPSTIHRLESNHLAQRVFALGQAIRQRRKVLGVSVTAAAEAAQMSRVTWHRIEKGEISVTIGAWFNALAVLGLEFGIGKAPAQEETAMGGAESEETASVPLEIRLRDYPQLQALAWQIRGTDRVTAREAFGIYTRNRRHIDWDSIQPRERELIDALAELFGEPGSV